MKRGEQVKERVTKVRHAVQGLPLLRMANTNVTISLTPIFQLSNVAFRKIKFENLSTNRIIESFARLCHIIAI